MQYKETNYKINVSPQPLRERYNFKLHLLLNFQPLMGKAPRGALRQIPKICERHTAKSELP